jgi:hypothetical protein
MVNSLGRSSGSWFTLLPAPSHLRTVTRDAKHVTSETAPSSPVTHHPSLSSKTVAIPGFVPIHSGGTVRDSHPLP